MKEKIKCLACKKEFPGSKGIYIINYAIDYFPKELYICETCSTEAAISFMQGKIPGGKILMKFLEKNS